MESHAVEQHDAEFLRKAEAKACASYLMHLNSHRSAGCGSLPTEGQRDARSAARET